MAQVIAFPGVVLPKAPQPPQPAKKAKPEVASPVVVKIRRSVTMPKANRPEDMETVVIARVADGFEADAYALAQSEPCSAKHLKALQLAGIRKNLPRNNLRIFTTPEDVVQGLWKAHRRVDIANAEYFLADLQHTQALHDKDEDASTRWGAIRQGAEARLWLQYERLIRIPATSLTQFDQFKRGKWLWSVGNLEWMRAHKPDLAAVVDDELARLEAEKAARGTKRKGKA
ncbi:hypothetical protein [Sphingomonas sp. PP-CC-3G-468]|uniref:hypothetical protein n=1 Tax=Sphingomonas sp. PP-CC-3G-468 TaxID=2135656 RepID=UPI00104F4B8D|nr:hypothetical protein [Sphingomonas sp. PP-CC-3G-468]TCM10358.1 hypothetical protein C8J41_101873 [Sphingomonas sp. PP-CC-3G-468]